MSAADSPTGTLPCGRFGIVSRPRLRRCSIAFELDVDLLDALRARPVGLLDRRGVAALPLRPRHFVAGGVLLALQSFDLRQQAAALRFERRELLELGLEVGAALRRAVRTRRRNLSRRRRGIEHGSSILYLRYDVP